MPGWLCDELAALASGRSAQDYLFTAVKGGLGHASVAITLDRYGHLYPGDLHLYVDRLGEVALAARADFLRARGDPALPTGSDDEAE